MSEAHARLVALICLLTLSSGLAGRTNVLRWSVFLEKDLGKLPKACSLTIPM